MRRKYFLNQHVVSNINRYGDKTLDVLRTRPDVGIVVSKLIFSSLYSVKFTVIVNDGSYGGKEVATVFTTSANSTCNIDTEADLPEGSRLSVRVENVGRGDNAEAFITVGHSEYDLRTEFEEEFHRSLEKRLDRT